MDIKERLIQFRKVLGISQTELAATLNILQGSLSDIERGKSNITVPHILLLNEKYDLNPNWLVLGIGQMFMNTDNNSSGLLTAAEPIEKYQNTPRKESIQDHLKSLKAEIKAIEKLLNQE